MKHRPEIDGLRAVAVLLVILFHAGFTRFPGGYIGVDVFFVISGYLITGLILRAHDESKFSIVSFYQRRVRRIVPALLVMMIAVLVAGYLLLPPMQYQWLGQSALATSVFASNIYFMLRGGNYFAQDAFFPLKHTWSLGVEEQFYLVLPALLMLAFRWGGRRLSAWVIVLAFVASLILALLMAGNASNGYYYNPLPRAWELLAGSLLALIPVRGTSQWVGDILVAVGLTMVIGSSLMLDATTPFPSAWTVFPIFGTVLVIRFAVEGTLAAGLLSSHLFVVIGQLSYSLYLWHYPVLIFAQYYGVDTTQTAPFVLSFGLIAALSIISYYLIERPVRFGIRSQVKQSVAALAVLVSSGVLAVLAFGINASGGLPSRGNLADLPEEYFAHAGKIQRFPSGIDGQPCTLGCTAFRSDGAEETWLLVGDSHANDFRDEALASARDANANLTLLIIPNCAYSEQDCRRGLAQLKRLLDDVLPSRVIFVSALAGSDSESAFKLHRDTAELMEYVLGIGAEVVFFSSRPRFQADPVRMALTGRMANITLDARWRAAYSNIDELVTQLSASYPLFRIVDQTQVLVSAGCGALSCFDGHDSARLPLYRDSNHLTEFGAAVVFGSMQGGR